ncbi:hypothetical protein KCU66_g22, partial [Aureobasidium melanogenum]
LRYVKPILNNVLRLWEGCNPSKVIADLGQRHVSNSVFGAPVRVVIIHGAVLEGVHLWSSSLAGPRKRSPHTDCNDRSSILSRVPIGKRLLGAALDNWRGWVRVSPESTSLASSIHNISTTSGPIEFLKVGYYSADAHCSFGANPRLAGEMKYVADKPNPWGVASGPWTFTLVNLYAPVTFWCSSASFLMVDGGSCYARALGSDYRGVDLSSP